MCSRLLHLTASMIGWMTGCLVLVSTFTAGDLSAQDVGGFQTRLNLAGNFVALGNRQQAEGELAQAIASYNRALKLESRSAEAYVGRAMVEQQQGKTDEAIADYKQAIRIKPRFAEAHHNYATLLYRRGDIDAALAEFNQAVRSNGHLAEPHAARGVIYYLRGNMKAAIEDLTQAIKLFPGYLVGAVSLDVHNSHLAMAYNSRGLARYASGDAKGAISDFSEAIRIGPDAEFYNNRGWARDKSGDAAGALDDYSAALAIDPKLVVAYYNRAKTRLRQGEMEGADSDFSQVLNLKDDLMRQVLDLPNVTSRDILYASYINRGLSREARGDIAAAGEDFSQAKTIYPQEAGGYANHGRIQMESGRLDDAIAELDKAIGMNANLAVPYMDRGLAHLIRGDKPAAEKDFQKCLLLDPSLKPLLDARVKAVQAKKEKGHAVPGDYSQPSA